jgi:xanthine dehydrogenase/oxidase
MTAIYAFLQDAIRENSFFDRFKPHLTKNNFEGGIRDAENALKGEVHMAGQEHFYLETHCTLAIPKEDNEMEIISSTQNPTEIQVKFSKIQKIPLLTLHPLYRHWFQNCWKFPSTG